MPRLRRREDENIVAVVPVQPLSLVISGLARPATCLTGKNVPLHLFPLPRTDLGDGIPGVHGVALLDDRLPR